MKIFTLLLGYLAVARFDYTVLGSPAGVAAGRKGDIMQQRNDAFTSGQALETRQGDPALFPLAVSLIVSAIGLDVQGKNGSTISDDEALLDEFTQRVVDTCAQAWYMWNWAIVISSDIYISYNLYSLKWGWYEYQLVLHGPYNFTVLWFQDARLSIMEDLGRGAWNTANTSYKYNTATTTHNETDIDFHAPDPGVIIGNGIKDDVDRMVVEIANAVANLGGGKSEKRAKFTRWVADNGTQHWSEFNWVVESDPHFIRPDGIIGTDWGVSLYELFFQSPSVFFYVYWLKSGKIVHEEEGGDDRWAWNGTTSVVDTVNVPSQYTMWMNNFVVFTTR